MKTKMTPEEIEAMLVKIYSQDRDTLHATKLLMANKLMMMEDETNKDEIIYNLIYDDLYDLCHFLVGKEWANPKKS